MRKLIDSKRVMISLPNDVRRWLEARAQYNATTISAEIVMSLRARMEERAAVEARMSDKRAVG
jgi:hypothetical protein